MTGERNPAQNRWLRFYNNFVYESLPAVYNALDWATLGAWWRLVRRALDEVPPGQRVLEIGFGPGRLQVELARRAALCVGLDLARGMCQYTHQRLQRAGLNSRVTQGSVYDLPYPAHSFDFVVSTFAFSGFPEGSRALDEMARVTAGGGSVVLVDIGLPQDGNRLGTMLARLWERMGDSLYDLPQMMQKAGLELVTFKEFGPGRHIRTVVGQRASDQSL